MVFNWLNYRLVSGRIQTATVMGDKRDELRKTKDVNKIAYERSTYYVGDVLGIRNS